MKRFLMLSVILVLFGLGSCTPTAYNLIYESRKPSDSGLDLGGKSMAVVYLESEDGRDSLYNNLFADAFAQALEEEYFGGEVAVDVFRQVKDETKDYSSVKEMSDLVLSLENDVIFLVDTPVISQDGKTTLTSLYAYDSMAGGADEVFKRSLSATSTVVVSQGAVARRLASSMSKDFVGNWTKESVILLCFDWEDEWIEAAIHANDMEWKEASDIWISLLGRKTGLGRSAAEYNLAVACYIEGELDLATEWLDRSDEDYNISISSNLRQMIEKKKAGN